MNTKAERAMMTATILQRALDLAISLGSTPEDAAQAMAILGSAKLSANGREGSRRRMVSPTTADGGRERRFRSAPSRTSAARNNKTIFLVRCTRIVLPPICVASGLPGNALRQVAPARQEHNPKVGRSRKGPVVPAHRPKVINEPFSEIRSPLEIKASADGRLVGDASTWSDVDTYSNASSKALSRSRWRLAGCETPVAASHRRSGRKVGKGGRRQPWRPLCRRRFQSRHDRRPRCIRAPEER